MVAALSPVSVLLIDSFAMTKPGLTLLAETYGLKRDDLNQLKLAGRRLFDEIREEIPRMTGKSLRTGSLDLRSENFSAFSATQPRGYFAAVGDENGLAAVMRADLSIACALLAAALGGRAPAEQKSGGEVMSLLESKVLSAMVGGVLLHGVNRAIVPMLGTKHLMRLAKISDAGNLAAEVSADSQPVIVASVECQFEGARGMLAVALMPRIAERLRAGLTAQAVTAARGRSRAGTRRAIPGSVGWAELGLRAVLGSTTMSLFELRRLAPGNIIFLRRMDGGSPLVELKCSDTPLFSGTVVCDRGWYRFVIERRMWNHAKPV